MSADTDRLPTLGGRYRLLRVIGSGGMALVYLAHDLTLDRRVAIKVLREPFSREPGFRERFQHEARAAANLSHPNIVTVYDFGYDEDTASLYLVMEYIPGTDLKSILKERGTLPVEEAVRLLIQAARGIGYAHRMGLIHCDVKPHNMLVTPDQTLKVTDFGIARAMASIQPDENSDVVWGSPLYFSPEQAAGRPPSPASDVYSLGVVLYEMLTGQPPFYASDPVELAHLHREEPPRPPRTLNPSIPVSLESIVLKLLEKEPARRYRTAQQLALVLEDWLQKAQTLNNEVTQTPSYPQPWTIPSSPPPPIEPLPVTPDSEDALEVDWITILLGLLAVLAVGGLIPFWLWIWLTFNPPR
ncbi:protein kinase [uncultured Thermanaerothrix sp.]|uniref:protein kinase domain-containing protein n=1 Tax=uncultured Thermanaerothrix sp. TaxID=1195149 RepID=UPI0026313E5C|nr:protein kinase [uncultured Thermanaerothrix sp.]